jgi:hypothetical protein
MERFYWREAELRPPGARFSEEVRGHLAWRSLVERVYETRFDRPEDGWWSLFDGFLAEVQREADQGIAPIGRPTKQKCCLFISHRMNDADNALHIAWLATQAGYDYWLDIHDPTLIAASGSALPSPAKDILIAAIIEIALLNVSHVIALHTRHSAGSKWIPYELGRAKARLVYSDQAAGWFDRHTPVVACGEYVYLARQTRTRTDIQSWLSSTKKVGMEQPCVPASGQTWGRGPPPPLDP